MDEHPESTPGTRLLFLGFAAATIGVGLGLQWGRPEISPLFADVLGDGLWALMIYWLVGAVRPDVRSLLRGAVALGICWLVEFSQLYHVGWLDDWRATTLGQLTLGSGFDPRDLVAYGLGVLIGLRLESTARQRRAAG